MLRAMPESSSLPLGAKQARLALWIVPPIIAVLVVFVWFISAGKWTAWPKTSVYDYYGSLAASFQQGHLYLDDEPVPELLALQDPYRIGLRKGIPYIWDASLYEERYYLYWGPVRARSTAHAALLARVRVLISTLPSALCVHCTWCFVVLCSGSGGAISRCCRAGRWLGLLISGLAPPLTWMLNRPEVYEAAIAAGQFFLLAGLYLGYTAFARKELPVWRLALASASWGLAVGSRSSQAVPVVFLLLVAVFALAAARNRLGQVARFRGALVALVIPVLGSALGLLWYNWARFDSAFESGYRYQLTLLQMPKHYDQLFAAAYIPPNLANYLMNPFTRGPGFPILRPQYGNEFADAAGVPDIYFAEAVTGLIYTFPFMVLALVPLLVGHRRPPAAVTSELGPTEISLAWLRAALLGVFLL
jgi:hypothetical protein